MRFAMLADGTQQRELLAFGMNLYTALTIVGETRHRVESQGVIIAFDHQLVDGIVERFPLRVALGYVCGIAPQDQTDLRHRQQPVLELAIQFVNLGRPAVDRLFGVGSPSVFQLPGEFVCLTHVDSLS
ncbi:hypothetical protein D3C84_987120 [compost metagenome]